MSNTIIRNGTLIDGNGGTPIPNAAVLIRENKIVAAGPQAAIQPPNAETQIIDANGGTIMPGLIDTHVHVMLQDINIPQLLATPFSLHFYKAMHYMRRTLHAGITTVRDAGGADLGIKQAVEQGLINGPRMQISITAMSITGGHGDGTMPSGVNLNFFPAHPGRPGNIADGVEGVRLKVRELLRAGADVIKICSTGGVLSPTDHPEFTQYSPEELDVIVREAAYRRGVKVMSHAQGIDGIRNAVEAGVHSIEHAIYLDEPLCELMIERGTFVVPTLLAPIAVLEDAATKSNMPEYAVAKSREVIEAHSASISLAHKMGVKIAMGTDAGVMPHGTNLRELGLMVGIGMTPMEAIVATTKTAAECLEWDDRVGTIETGKLADIIISSVNPIADINGLADNDNIPFVMQNGKIKKNNL